MKGGKLRLAILVTVSALVGAMAWAVFLEFARSDSLPQRKEDGAFFVMLESDGAKNTKEFARIEREPLPAYTGAFFTFGDDGKKYSMSKGDAIIQTQRLPDGNCAARPDNFTIGMYGDVRKVSVHLDERRCTTVVRDVIR